MTFFNHDFITTYFVVSKKQKTNYGIEKKRFKDKFKKICLIILIQLMKFVQSGYHSHNQYVYFYPWNPSSNINN